MPTLSRTGHHVSFPHKHPPSPKHQRMSNGDGSEFHKGNTEVGWPHPALATPEKDSHTFLWKLRDFFSPRSAWGPQLSPWFLLSPPMPSPAFFLLSEAIQLSPNFSHKHSNTLSKTRPSLETRPVTLFALRRPHFPTHIPSGSIKYFSLEHSAPSLREILVNASVTLRIGYGSAQPYRLPSY